MIICFSGFSGRRNFVKILRFHQITCVAGFSEAKISIIASFSSTTKYLHIVPLAKIIQTSKKVAINIIFIFFLFGRKFAEEKKGKKKNGKNKLSKLIEFFFPLFLSDRVLIHSLSVQIEFVHNRHDGNNSSEKRNRYNETTLYYLFSWIISFCFASFFKFIVIFIVFGLEFFVLFSVK